MAVYPHVRTSDEEAAKELLESSADLSPDPRHIPYDRPSFGLAHESLTVPSFSEDQCRKRLFAYYGWQSLAKENGAHW